MSTPAPSPWEELINAFMNALIGVVTGIANWLSANSTMIVSILIGIGMFTFLYRKVLRRFLPGITEFLGGLVG